MSNTFTSRPFDANQEKLQKIIQSRFEQIEHDILEGMGHSRYRALALTELEKTHMVVNKAISRMNDVNERT